MKIRNKKFKKYNQIEENCKLALEVQVYIYYNVVLM